MKSRELILIILLMIFTSSKASSEVYFVHGTNTNSKVWNNLIRVQIKEIFHIKEYSKSDELFEWSGGNNTKSRKNASKQLVKHIINVRNKHNITSKITIVGHSHGGNVVLLASKKLREILGNDIEINIITLNTPNVVGGAKIEGFKIKHYHIYCPKDKVVPRAGFNKTGLKKSGGEKKTWIGSPKGGEFSNSKDLASGKLGSTCRTFKTAIKNIPYKDQYFFKGLIPKTHFVSHRGWLKKNVEQWIFELKKAVENN